VRLWIERYTALIRAAWMIDLQYRADVFLWLLWGITEPAVALGIWWTIAKGAPGGEVNGYTGVDFVSYFFGVTLVNQLTQAWDAWYIDQWIADGELNHRLTRPMHPMHESIADNIAYKARTATVIVALWITISIVWPDARLPLDWQQLGLAAIAIVLGAAIKFLNSFTIGLLGFWTTRAMSLVELQMAVGMFLSGEIAPVDLLPQPIRIVAHALWFPYVLAFPVQLLAGYGDEHMAVWQGFLGQIIWLVIWWIAFRIMWKRGLKHYGAVGG